MSGVEVFLSASSISVNAVIASKEGRPGNKVSVLAGEGDDRL